MKYNDFIRIYNQRMGGVIYQLDIKDLNWDSDGIEYNIELADNQNNKIVQVNIMPQKMPEVVLWAADNPCIKEKVNLTCDAKEDVDAIIYSMKKIVKKVAWEEKMATKSNVGVTPRADYTFDSFVVGESNRLAYAACREMADLSQDFNLLFLYGETGFGKTHLMHAVANYIAENNPDKKIMLINTNDLINEVIEMKLQINCENEKSYIENLSEKYARIDVLLIEDVQFLVGKKYTQEETLHILDSFVGSGKQIMLSCDRPPEKLNALENSLISKFSMGLCVDISEPDFETRKEILCKKNQLEKYGVRDEILEYIAEHIVTNPSCLMGALKRVVAFSRLNKKELTLEDVRQGNKVLKIVEE